MYDLKSVHTYTNGQDFPNTAAKESSGGSAIDGTRFSKKLVDDIWGFFQACLHKAGITPSGTAENANTSQVLDGIIEVVHDAEFVTYSNIPVSIEWLDGSQSVEAELKITKSGNLCTVSLESGLVESVYTFVNTIDSEIVIKPRGVSTTFPAFMSTIDRFVNCVISAHCYNVAAGVKFGNVFMRYYPATELFLLAVSPYGGVNIPANHTITLFPFCATYQL